MTIHAWQDQPDAPATEQLDDQQATALGQALAQQLTAKVDAGTRLFFALYHHPQARELMPQLLDSRGFRLAYDAACATFAPRP